MRAIFKRELRAYFTSPIGYIFIAVMAAFEGSFFARMFSAGYPDITYVFNQMYMLTFLLIPVLTMRTMSEDRAHKVDQVLITSPVSLTGIVMGKFFATLTIFLSGYAMTLVFQIIVAFQNVTVNLARVLRQHTRNRVHGQRTHSARHLYFVTYRKSDSRRIRHVHALPCDISA